MELTPGPGNRTAWSSLVWFVAMTYQPKACATCNSTFVPTSGVAKYCSPTCRPKPPPYVPKGISPKACAGCGAVFTPKTNGTLYCSDKCHPWHRDPGRAEARRNRPAKGNGAAYQAAHVAVYRAFGRAADYLCVSCARPAHEWAFDDQEPMLLDPVSGKRYYPDISRYRPLCRFCHDKGRLEP